MLMARQNITWNKMPNEGVIVISGHRGEGKSALAWWLAETQKTKTKKRISALGIPEKARKAMPKRIVHVDSVEQVADLKPSIVVADEASFVANARRAQSTTNVMWLKLIAVCRHKGHLLIFVSQHNKQLDVQILMDADFVIMKRPTLLHLKFCRPEFRDELQEAYNEFESMRRSMTKKKAYVVDYHNGSAKMLTASMPKWWSEKVSKAYATVSLDGEGK
jgi:excinuclease UvrABC ATPase subunit|tara:strand:- start:644 stop:1300 length:657 start_codon:yes stop_codon:yes gene_type:complete